MLSAHRERLGEVDAGEYSQTRGSTRSVAVMGIFRKALDLVLTEARHLVWHNLELGRVSFTSITPIDEPCHRLVEYLNAHPFRFQVHGTSSHSVTYSLVDRSTQTTWVTCSFQSSPNGTTMEVVVSRTGSHLLGLLLLSVLVLALRKDAIPFVTFVVGGATLMRFGRKMRVEFIAEGAAAAVGLTNRYSAFTGPPCPVCGKALLSSATRQCLNCHASWHGQASVGASSAREMGASSSKESQVASSTPTPETP